MKKKRNFFGLKAFACSAVAMALSASVGTSVQASAFADTSGHWAENAIERWASYDVIAGYNGYFRPDDPITRGDMAVIINRIMDYQIESTRYYSDLDENYYTSPIRKLNSAGFMEGFESTIRPKDYITREEAAVVIANAMHLDVRPTTDGTYETTFTDNYQIAYWAKNSIYMLNNLGALNGRSTNYFEPQVNITRAEVAYALDKLIEEFIYVKEGYSINSVNGTVVINEAGVSLENMTITGNLILAEGIADGDIYLDNVVVKGNIIIKGGSTNTIYVDDVTCNGRMEVSRVDAATLVKMRGSSSIPTIDIYNDCTVDGSRLDYGNSLGDITIYPDAANVTILGDVDKVTNESPGCDITLGGSFGSVNMNQQGTVNDTSYSAGSKVDVSAIPGTTADLAPGIYINPIFPNSYASAFISVSDPTIDVETGDVEVFVYVSSVANCDLMSVAKNAITIADGQDLTISVEEYEQDETFGTTVYKVNFTVARNVERVELDVNFSLISNAPDITVDKNFDEVDSTKNPSASVQITEIEEAEDGMITMTLIVSHMEDCRLPLDPSKAVTINPASGKDADDYPEITVVEGYGSTTTLTAYQISFYPDEDQDTLPLQVNFLDADSTEDFSSVEVSVNMNYPAYDEDEDEEPTADYVIKSLIDDIDAGVTSFRLEITNMEHCELPDDDVLAITCDDEDDLSVVTMINTGTRRYFYISVPYDEDRTEIEINVNFVDDVHVWDGEYLITSEGHNYNYFIQIDDSETFLMHDGIKLDGGEVVTITPATGETIYSVQILSDNITKVKDLVQNADGSWTFTMPTADITLFVSNTNVTSTMKVNKGANSANFDVYLVQDGATVDVGIGNSFVAMQYVYITPEVGYKFNGTPSAVDASGNAVTMTQVDDYFYAIAPTTGDVTVTIAVTEDVSSTYYVTADTSDGNYAVTLVLQGAVITAINRYVNAGSLLYVEPDFSNGDIAAVYVTVRGVQSYLGTLTESGDSSAAGEVLTYNANSNVEFFVKYYNSSDLSNTATYSAYLQGVEGGNTARVTVTDSTTAASAMTKDVVVDLTSASGWSADLTPESEIVAIVYDPSKAVGLTLLNSGKATFNATAGTATFSIRGEVSEDAKVTFVLNYGDDLGQNDDLEEEEDDILVVYEAYVDGLANEGDNQNATVVIGEDGTISVDMAATKNYKGEGLEEFLITIEPDIGLTVLDSFAKWEDYKFSVPVTGDPTESGMVTLRLTFDGVEDPNYNGTPEEDSYTVTFDPSDFTSVKDGDGNNVTTGSEVPEDTYITVAPTNPDDVLYVYGVEDGEDKLFKDNGDRTYTYGPVTGDITDIVVVYKDAVEENVIHLSTNEPGIPALGNGISMTGNTMGNIGVSSDKVPAGETVTVTAGTLTANGKTYTVSISVKTLADEKEVSCVNGVFTMPAEEVRVVVDFTEVEETFTVSTFDDPDFTVKVNGEIKNLPMTVTADDEIQIVPTSGKVIDFVKLTNGAVTPTEDNDWIFKVSGDCVVEVIYKTVLEANLIKVEEKDKEADSTATISLHNVTTNNGIIASSTSVTEGNLFSVTVDGSLNQTYSVEVTDENSVVINPTSGSNIYTMPATAVTVTVTYKTLEEGEYSIHPNVTPTSVGGGYTLKVNDTTTTENFALEGDKVEVVVTEVPGYAWTLTVTEGTTTGNAVTVNSTTTGGTFTMPSANVYLNIHYVEDFTVTYSDEVTVTGIQGYTDGPLKATITVDSDGNITGNITAAELASKGITQDLSSTPIARTINPSSCGLTVTGMTATKNVDGSITFKATAGGTLQSNAGVVFSLDFESEVTTYRANVTFAFVGESGNTVSGLTAATQSVTSSGTLVFDVANISGYEIISTTASVPAVMSEMTAETTTTTNKIILSYTLATLTQNEDVTVTFVVKEVAEKEEEVTFDLTAQFVDADSGDAISTIKVTSIDYANGTAYIVVEEAISGYVLENVIVDGPELTVGTGYSMGGDTIRVPLTVNDETFDGTAGLTISLKEVEEELPEGTYYLYQQGNSTDQFEFIIDGDVKTSASVEAGTEVIIRAELINGTKVEVVFSDGSDPVSLVATGGNLEATFEMPEDSVGVNVIYSYPVTIVKTPTTETINSTVTLNGYTMESGVYYVPVGDSVTINVVEASGEKLKTLVVNEDTKLGTYTFTMPEKETEITADFAVGTYNVTIDSSNYNDGVVFNTTTMTSSTTYVEVSESDSVVIKPTAKTGYNYQISWTIDGDNTIYYATVNQERTITMGTSNVTVKVIYTAQEYTVTVEGAANGTVTATAGSYTIEENGTETLSAGTVVTINAVPDSGYRLDSLKVMNGTTELEDFSINGTSYTYTVGGEDVTIQAAFTQISVTAASVTYDYGDGSQSTVNTPTISENTEGVYQVTVDLPTGWDSDTDTITSIAINSVGSVSYEFTASPLVYSINQTDETLTFDLNGTPTRDNLNMTFIVNVVTTELTIPTVTVEYGTTTAAQTVAATSTDGTFTATVNDHWILAAGYSKPDTTGNDWYELTVKDGDGAVVSSPSITIGNIKDYGTWWTFDIVGVKVGESVEIVLSYEEASYQLTANPHTVANGGTITGLSPFYTVQAKDSSTEKEETLNSATYGTITATASTPVTVTVNNVPAGYEAWVSYNGTYVKATQNGTTTTTYDYTFNMPASDTAVDVELREKVYNLASTTKYQPSVDVNGEPEELDGVSEVGVISSSYNANTEELVITFNPNSPITNGVDGYTINSDTALINLKMDIDGEEYDYGDYTITESGGVYTMTMTNLTTITSTSDISFDVIYTRNIVYYNISVIVDNFDYKFVINNTADHLSKAEKGDKVIIQLTPKTNVDIGDYEVLALADIEILKTSSLGTDVTKDYADLTVSAGTDGYEIEFTMGSEDITVKPTFKEKS